jgi:hypothetical protein
MNLEDAMKRLMIVAMLLWGGGSCLAQEGSSEIQGLYIRLQGFNFNAGGSLFNIQGASGNGGGYVYVRHFTDRFGMFQQMAFIGGPQDNGFKVRLLTEFQGFQLTRGKGPLLVYAKGGLGFTRYMFAGGFSGSTTNFAVNYGGGAQIKIKEGLGLVLEATRITMRLPNLTGAADRSSWANAWQLATGIAIHF